MGNGPSESRAASDNTLHARIKVMTEFKCDCTGSVKRLVKGRDICVTLFALVLFATSLPLVAQQNTSDSKNTQLQREIEIQRGRMQSSDVEQRRDALLKLGWMRQADGSRIAAGALNDPVPVVRATAAIAILSLQSAESVALLVPLLKDKDEFVRQQVAYALGETRNSNAASELVTVLVTDKKPSVRGAAAVALGMIADESASAALARIVDPGFQGSGGFDKNSKQKKEDDQFVKRAAARALGQIGSRSSVPALIAAMSNKRLDTDMRREIVVALGLIGDAAAIPVLRENLSAPDPYLAQYAYEALQKITAPQITVRP